MKKKNLFRKFNPKLPLCEQELILAHILKKSREYVLAHPEIKLNKLQQKKYQNMIKRRLKNEPLAYILGHQGFYGLDFKVNRHTLIPRPETEHLVDAVIDKLKLVSRKRIIIIDIGTGSGNIIISIAHNTKHMAHNKINFYGTDISTRALKIAKYNAKKYVLNKKIKFIRGDLLNPFIQNSKLKIQNYIIVANLPYLSKKIYNSAKKNVKNYEPKSALYGGTDGLDYYKKLFKQIKILMNNRYALCVTCYAEISPEQKNKLEKTIKHNFPDSPMEFKKDLAQKWRMVQVEIILK